jgi:hypothetical protein
MTKLSASEQIRQLLLPHQPELVAKAAELAKLGEPVALRMCLERLAPTPRPEAEKVVVPGLKEAPSLQAKATAILAAVADGQISAEAGDKLLRMLDSYGRAVVLDEHEQRLRLIEQGQGHRRLSTRPVIEHDITDLL